MAKYTWEYSENEEFWNHGLFDTVEECIQDAKENYDIESGETITIGEAVWYEPQVWASDVLEDLEQEAYEEYGECAEGWDTFDYKKDREKLDELSDQLTEVVKAWLEKYNRKPYFYRIHNIEVIEVE